MRLAALVEYVGSKYSGWQRQHHAVTVQGEIERALSQIANATVTISCAGRTDAGVHALGQVIHFDTDAVREPVSWLFGANALLPPDISLRWIQNVDSEFHARYSALGRQYRYVIHDQQARSALLNGRVTWSRQSLDSELMHHAGQCLLGENDFSAFRAAECQSKSSMRNLKKLSVSRDNSLILIDVEANAFLHHMVRNIAGVLIAVGSGKQPVEWVSEVLESKMRSKAGVTADAAGLYFMSVEYPETFGLPKIKSSQFLMNFH